MIYETPNAFFLLRCPNCAKKASDLEGLPL
jgi:hypothetical protein